MINAILLPTDFSVVAYNALSYAVKLAEKCGAELHILHIKQIPIADPSFPAETYQMYIEEIEKAEKEGVEKLKSSFIKDSNVVCNFHSATGFVADEIMTFCKSHTIDLVVMGTTGASGLAELLVGSNAASVIGKSEVPVLVIPPNHVYKAIKHVMYSTDFNEPELPAATRVLYFAELYDAKVTVLHVKNDYDSYFKADNNYFLKNKESLAKHDINLINEESDDVMSTIDKHIDDLNIDLLVMAKHKRGFFDRLFHRSLSKQMAYHTKTPLLVLNKEL
jgi:nucleotide-binding universal stress UspA family protein